MTRLFVSGPMSGLPGYNLPAFAEATDLLESVRFRDVVNPGRFGVIPGYEWRDYMRDSIRGLLLCDAVAVLDGWQESKGARLEVTIAMDLEMPVHGVDWWLENGVTGDGSAA